MSSSFSLPILQAGQVDQIPTPDGVQLRSPATRPFANHLPDLDTRPICLLDVHRACNQTCSYCVSGSSPRSDFGAMGDNDRRNAIERFFATHGPFTVLLTGGEPLLTPGLFDFLDRLQSFGHDIAMQSNLKSNKLVRQFAERVSPERCRYVMTTFHSVELKRWPQYLRNVVTLREAGHGVVVKLVLDRAMLSHFDALFDQLVDLNIGCLLSPLVEFSDGDAVAIDYTPEQWHRLAPRMTTLSTWLYFASGLKSRGVQCRAGEAALFPHVQDEGTVTGCAHSFPRNLGNLYDNELTKLSEPTACGLDRCICDYHTYSGLIPRLDDRDGFARLLTGDNAAVGFETYESWLADAGYEGHVDLRPLLEQAGAIPRSRRAG